MIKKMLYNFMIIRCHSRILLCHSGPVTEYGVNSGRNPVKVLDPCLRRDDVKHNIWLIVKTVTEKYW